MFINEQAKQAAKSSDAKYKRRLEEDAIRAEIAENQKRRVRAIIRNIDHPDRILVMFRKNNDGRTIKIMLPGGGVEFDETVYQALQREIAEELGVNCPVTSHNCKYFDSVKVFRKNKRELTDADVANAKANSDYVELIFMDLHDFDYVPINREAYRGVLGFAWMTPKEIEVKLEDKECVYIAQTYLRTVLRDLIRCSSRYEKGDEIADKQRIKWMSSEELTASTKYAAEEKINRPITEETSRKSKKLPF